MTAGCRPEDFARRSFVHRELAAAGARFAEHAGAACAVDFGQHPGDEAAQARRLGLADLSPLPRSGLKGTRVMPWLAQHGAAADGPHDRAYPHPGGLVAKLGANEALILDDPEADAGLSARLRAAWTPEGAPRCYPVPRADSHFWFALSGRHVPEVLAKLCGVDLRPHRFDDRRIAQTSVARMNAIILRADLGPTLAYHLLGDSAAASYLWGCLLDAMAEFDGRPVGLAALSNLRRPGATAAQNR